MLEDHALYLDRKVTILNQLAAISVVLNSTYELGVLLNHLMDAAASITESEAASVLLWDENTRELRFAATTTHQAGLKLIGSTVPLEGSLAGTALLENRVVQVDDALHDPRHYSRVDEATQLQTRSLLAVPMRQRDRLTGVLEVINKRQLPWTKDDHDHLMVLASQAAVAIESAQLVTQLQKANEELSQVDNLKNEFIAIASHELRTPLAIILGYASFLKEEAQGQLSDHVEKVMAAGLQLRRIIEDLVNLRYLQQNPSELHLETLPLKKIIDETIKEMRELAEAAQHRLEVSVPGDIQVHIDHIRTEMALKNVMNNAIRFTPPGGQIKVRVEVRDNHEVWVAVTDSGIGLEADQLERIFEKFYQVEDHMTRQYGGLGIGLSITRAMIEAQGGRVWASSPGLGQGSTFILAFPTEATVGSGH
jgi:signal transduction histidine kinase